MNRSILSSGLVALTVLLPAPVQSQDYYTDIRPVLTGNCLACHTEAGPGWSMEDPEATFERSRLIAAMVLDRLMPPWIAEPGHQAYLDDPTLDPEVLAMIRGGGRPGSPEGSRARTRPPRPLHPMVPERMDMASALTSPSTSCRGSPSSRTRTARTTTAASWWTGRSPSRRT
jgi:hypothetical protein